MVTVVALFAVGILRPAVDNELLAADLRATLLIVTPFGYTHVAEWYHWCVFRTDFAANGDEVFVFGREVKDFRNVDYDAIGQVSWQQHDSRAAVVLF